MKFNWQVRRNATRFLIELGWFPGEPFQLLNVCLLEIAKDYLSILDIHIAKFVLSVGLFW